MRFTALCLVSLVLFASIYRVCSTIISITNHCISSQLFALTRKNWSRSMY